MLIFEIVIALLLIGAALALLAERIDAPYPAFLALAGAALALLPGMPSVTLDPELALVLFVAPTLLDAAFDASPRDLRENLVSVSSLALLAVLLTIAAVAVVARMAMPGLGWAAAIALGAIVAPPDASAATAVLRKLRPPHRILVILEGESLFNDASALLVYRIAAAAAMTGVFSGGSVLFILLLTSVGGVVLGIALAKVFLWVARRVDDIAVSVLMQFLSTFAVWLLADHLQVSAILTMVAYAMTLARHAPGFIGARRRIASYAVWEVAVFVLNVLAFVLIGLQLRGILSRVQVSEWPAYVNCALVVCSTVIGVRIVWCMLSNSLARWRVRHRGANPQRSRSLPTVGGGLLISWCGMRGIVTLAAALALPDGGSGAAFPYRDLIVFSAFCVVLSTLVLQGWTVGPLMRRLQLQDDGSVEKEVLVARRETARTALAILQDREATPAAELLRREYEARLRFNETPAERESPAQPSADLTLLQHQTALAQKQKLMELRASGVIGDDAFHVVEEEIDLLDLSADARIHPDEHPSPVQ